MQSGRHSSAPWTERNSHRPEQITLVEEGESASIPPHTVAIKDRALLFLLTGPLQGTIVQLGSTELSIGRSKRAGLFIPDPGLSRIHAHLSPCETPEGPGYSIEDCQSTNGTFVRGRSIDRRVTLQDGDRIGLGRRTVLRFSLQDPFEAQALIRVHRSALHDPLTGVFNRGAFDDRLQSEFSMSAKRGTPLALCLFDVDHFKRVNDTYGHPAGDAVLKAVARTVQAVARVEDVVARYGGEEFAVVVRGVSMSVARALAEQVRQRVEALRTPWGQQTLSVTISVGVAHLHSAQDVESPTQLVQAADAALYAAKKLGRNRVVFAS
jgi:two-component system, cell cycle response regulator